MPFQIPVQYQLGNGNPRMINPLLGCLPLFVAMLLLCIVPLFLYDTARTAFERLGLNPATAGLVVAGIAIGSLINIPVYRIHKDELQPEASTGTLGSGGERKYRRVQIDTCIAVNLGGCVIPAGLAILQLMHLARAGQGPLLAGLLVSLISIVVCWRLARPVEGLGILIPGFIPPLACLLSTWLLLGGADPGQRAATAFLAGVAGPLIGADLLHLRDLTKTPIAMMSIGGAGTFDGIVLSGILTALLA